jgi:integrase
MVPRPRNQGSKDLPPNLYRKTDQRNGITYYTYRDPVSGRTFGLGKDKEAAIREAVAANHAEVLKPTLASRVSAQPAEKSRTFSEWVSEHKVIYADKGLSIHTLKSYRSRIQRLEDEFGAREIRGIRTMDVAGFLSALSKAGKGNMSKALRSLLRDVFAEAMAAGWCDSNPVDATRAPRIQVKRERLSLELWKAIYEEAERPWLKRAMELALLTGQRREDIGAMLFSEEVGGFLHVVQSKTKAKLRINTAIRLDALDLDLATVIKRCRDRVVSKYMIHHPKTVGSAKAGTRLKLDRLSAGFAEARDKAAAKLGITLGRTPPTFHEMRSLAARLHAAEGRDPQNLLGHRNAAMTELYRDSRGTEWIDVA